MLKTFLHNGLYAAFTFTYLVSQTTHFPDIEFTAKNKKGNNENDYTGQRTIHQEKENKCSKKLHTGTYKGWDILSQEVDNVTDISLNTIEKIAGMELLQLLPLAIQQARKQSSPHPVLPPPLKWLSPISKLYQD